MSDLRRPISTETALQLLTKRQRRQILRRVADTPDGTTVDHLEEHPGVADSTNPGGNGSLERRGIELHHVHLPKLQEADVIVYDSDQQTVRRGRHFEDVLDLLRLIEEYREEVSTTTA